jgi:hypothetical protein
MKLMTRVSLFRDEAQTRLHTHVFYITRRDEKKIYEQEKDFPSFFRRNFHFFDVFAV